jgi:hypothetical protein
LHLPTSGCRQAKLAIPEVFSITVIALFYIVFALGGHFYAVPGVERIGTTSTTGMMTIAAAIVESI